MLPHRPANCLRFYIRRFASRDKNKDKARLHLIEELKVGCPDDTARARTPDGVAHLFSGGYPIARRHTLCGQGIGDQNWAYAGLAASVGAGKIPIFLYCDVPTHCCTLRIGTVKKDRYDLIT